MFSDITCTTAIEKECGDTERREYSSRAERYVVFENG